MELVPLGKFEVTPYRISTMTVTGSINSNIDLQKLFDHIDIESYENIKYMEYGANKNEHHFKGELAKKNKNLLRVIDALNKLSPKYKFQLNIVGKQPDYLDTANLNFKIKFEQLEELLGNHVNQDEDHYNFTWHGKKKAARLAQTPSTGTLRPAKDESVDFDNTQNLFIEGDNYMVFTIINPCIIVT